MVQSTFKEIKETNDNNKDTKVIIVNGFSNKQLNTLIDYYKNNPELPKTIFATTTPASKNMRLRELIKELETEKRNIRQNIT